MLKEQVKTELTTRGPLTAGEIAAALNKTQSSIRRRLTDLKREGAVSIIERIGSVNVWAVTQPQQVTA